MEDKQLTPISQTLLKKALMGEWLQIVADDLAPELLYMTGTECCGMLFKGLLWLSSLSLKLCLYLFSFSRILKCYKMLCDSESDSYRLANQEQISNCKQTKTPIFTDTTIFLKSFRIIWMWHIFNTYHLVNNIFTIYWPKLERGLGDFWEGFVVTLKRPDKFCRIGWHSTVQILLPFTYVSSFYSHPHCWWPASFWGSCT